MNDACSLPDPAACTRLDHVAPTVPYRSGPARDRGTRMGTLRAMRIPVDAQIRALHEKHAPTAEALDLVYAHCQIVCGIAEQLHGRAGAASGTGLDIALVRAGCLLHDIGVYRLYDESGRLDGPNYVRHGVLGYDLLKTEGLPEGICRFASHHTGA